eukprot:766347-Hanusia_phi.AAC.6
MAKLPRTRRVLAGGESASSASGTLSTTADGEEKSDASMALDLASSSFRCHHVRPSCLGARAPGGPLAS